MFVKNPMTGEVKKVKRGFSWTMLFFGAFVPLFRGDWKWFFLSWLLAIVTVGIAWLVLPFKYNKIYMKELHMKGFRPVGAEELQ